MNKTSVIVSLIYAVLLFVGGIIGFLKAGSPMSLIAGISSCILILAFLFVGKTKTELGYILISSISFILLIFFVFRFFKTHSFMPSGLMSILSLVNLGVVSMNLFNKTKKINA